MFTRVEDVFFPNATRQDHRQFRRTPLKFRLAITDQPWSNENLPDRLKENRFEIL